MAEQLQKQKAAPQEREAETAHSEGGQPADLTETDALLAEIDAVLDDVLGEKSAQEFVASYQQKGGE